MSVMTGWLGRILWKRYGGVAGAVCRAAPL
jgi:hypothetical protein